MIKIFFATDLHGSLICFKKFLKAREFYRADVLFLGGDYTNKDLILYSRNVDGWRAVSGSNKAINITSIQEMDRLKSEALQAGKMVQEIDLSVLENLDKASYAAILEGRIKTAQLEWYDLASRATALTKHPIYVIPGNDDPPYTDEIFSRKPFKFVYRKFVQIDEDITVLGWGGSNPTPWHTIREYSECDIAKQLEETRATGSSPVPTILFAHPPPLGSGLDLAPIITDDLSYSFSMGSVRRKSIGSSAIRHFIETYQPALGLFGYVHEVRGYQQIGQTICINSGSVFLTGKLQGCLISFDRGKVIDFQFTEG